MKMENFFYKYTYNCNDKMTFVNMESSKKWVSYLFKYQDKSFQALIYNRAQNIYSIFDWTSQIVQKQTLIMNLIDDI